MSYSSSGICGTSDSGVIPIQPGGGVGLILIDKQSGKTKMQCKHICIQAKEEL